MSQAIPSPSKWTLQPWQIALALVVMLALAVIAGIGLIGLDLRKQFNWDIPGFASIKRYTYGYAIAAAVYLLARRRFLRHLTLALLLYVCAVVGPGPLLAVAFIAASSLALGDACLRRLDRDRRFTLANASVALLTGIALWIFAAGVAAHFPINYPFVYYCALSLPLLVNRRPVSFAWRVLTTKAFLRRPLGLIDYAAQVLLGYVFVPLVALATKPEVAFDALAMHLTLPAWVARHHSWSFDYRNVAWSVMPLGGDWAFTIAYLTGGEFAARFLNVLFLLILCTLMWTTLRLWTKGWHTTLLVAAFASAPLTFLVTDSLFVENALAAILFGAVIAGWRFASARRSPDLFACGTLTGCALATKFGSLPLVALLLIALTAMTIRYRRSVKAWHVAVTFILTLVTGLYQYVFAYAVTGNPIYPFPNALFKARPGLEFAFESAYHEKLTPTTLYDLTFKTSQYVEGRDGGFGIHFLLLIPLALLPLLRRAPALARMMYAAGAFMFLMVFKQQPYIRYLYPTLILLIAPCVVLLAQTGRLGAFLRWSLAGLLAFGVLMNLYLMPRGNVYHPDFLYGPFEHAWRSEQYVAETAPSRKLVQLAKQLAPDKPLLFLGVGHVGGHDGRSFSESWHHPGFWPRLYRIGSPGKLAQMLKQEGAEFVVAGPKEQIRPELLRKFVSDYTIPEHRINGWVLARIQEGRRPDADLPLLTNGDFRDPLTDWDIYGRPVHERASHRIRVSINDTIFRRVPVEEGITYRYTMEASCEGTGNMLRLQINWHDSSDKFIGTHLEPRPCSSQPARYETKAKPPKGAVSGVVIVGGHTDKPVWVDRVALEE